jgi:hypothetical protein
MLNISAVKFSRAVLLPVFNARSVPYNPLGVGAGTGMSMGVFDGSRITNEWHDDDRLDKGCC